MANTVTGSWWGDFGLGLALAAGFIYLADREQFRLFGRACRTAWRRLWRLK